MPPTKLMNSNSAIRDALQYNPKFIDKNVHETMNRIKSYRIHREHLQEIKQDLERKRQEGVIADPKLDYQRKMMNANRIRT